MDKTILVINATAEETRVALLESGNTAELLIEREKDRGLLGNIYKGRVARVLPGMQAAFVDIGLERAAFLYVGDIIQDPMEAAEAAEKQEDAEDDQSLDRVEKSRREEPTGEEQQSPTITVSAEEAERHGAIEDLLEEGQELLVQVVKDPIGTKGCRVSTHISLAGRHLVYMPLVDHLGVSRRIADKRERDRLSAVLNRFRELEKTPGGFIARTASEGVSVKKLRNDMQLLVNLWREIQNKAPKRHAPELLYEELNLALRAARDLFTSDIDRLVVDEPRTYEKIVNFIDRYMPKLKPLVELYKGVDPIFDHFSVEMEINRALGRKVWLKSGGYIVIDQTEALTAIDVNTGRFVGKHNLEDTILKTNMEAVKEIVEQLRLRNLGGIIIVDFIDMEKEANRQKVIESLKEELKLDKAKTHVSEISELGLVQMTRKRVRESIGHVLCEPCFYCDGKGYLKSKTSICYEIFRDIKRQARLIRGDTIVVNAHPEICDMMSNEESQGLSRLESEIDKKIFLRSLPYFHVEQYEVMERQPHHTNLFRKTRN